MRNAPLIALLGALVLGLAAWLLLDEPAPDTTNDLAGPAAVAPIEEEPAERSEASSVEALEASAGGKRDVIEVVPRETGAPEPGAAAASGPALTGRVLSTAGRAVVGARVLAGGDDILPLDYLAVDGGFGQRWSTVTDDEGRFELRGPRPGALRIGVFADGFAPHERGGVKLAAGQGTDVGELVLEQGVRLSGVVANEAGAPVAGAKLFAEGAEEGMFRLSLPSSSRRAIATTDKHGQFDIHTLAAGPWRLRVVAEAYPERVFEGHVEAPGGHQAGLTFTLPTGARIAGRVVGLPGGGAEGLGVLARPAKLDFWDPNFQPRTAPLGADGSFDIGGCLVDERYEVMVTENTGAARGFIRVEGAPRSNVVEVDSGSVGVQLTYQDGHGVTFLVQDEHGAPLEEVEVLSGRGFLIPHRRDGERVKSYPGGRVLIDNMPNFRAGFGGNLEVVVSAPGYSTESVEVEDVDAGGVQDLGVIVLKKVPVVRVRVVDAATRTPVEGARVSMSLQREGGPRIAFETADFGRSNSEERTRRAETGADGVALLSAFSGERVDFTARAEGFTAGKLAGMALPASGDVEVELELTVGGRVVVTALTADGEPLAGARVETRRPPEPSPEGAMMMGAAMALGGPPTEEDVTDDQGQIVFEHLEPGAHQFRIAEAMGGMVFMEIDGGAPASKGWREVSVGEKETVELELRDVPRAVVAGTVREGGRPLAGARVVLYGKSGERTPEWAFFNPTGDASSTTDGSGRYSIERVKPGDYTVVVRHPTREMDFTEDVTISAGENQLPLELPIAIVEGRVIDAEGQPIAGAKVRAVKFGGQEGNTFQAVSMFVTSEGGGSVVVGGDGGADPSVTNANGEYSLRGVLTNTPIQVAVDHEGSAPVKSEPFEVAPGGIERGVDVQLEVAGSARLSVTGATGGGMFFVTATYLDADGVEPRSETIFGEDATMENLRVGRWRFQLREMSQGGPPTQRDHWTLEAEVTADLPADVVFTY